MSFIGSESVCVCVETGYICGQGKRLVGTVFPFSRASARHGRASPLSARQAAPYPPHSLQGQCQGSKLNLFIFQFQLFSTFY